MTGKSRVWIYSDVRYHARIIALSATLHFLGATGLNTLEAYAACSAGRVFAVSGSVLIRSLGVGGAAARVAKVGDCVERGSVINTASNGKAKLLLEDRSIIDIGGSTSYHFEELKLADKGSLDNRDVSMSIDYGKVRASVNAPIKGQGKFRVRTRAATMGVRGTEFVVDAGSPLQSGDQASSSVTVLSGRVDVDQKDYPSARQPNVANIAATDSGRSGLMSAGGTVILTAGMQASVTMGSGGESSPGAVGAARPGQAQQIVSQSEPGAAAQTSLDPERSSSSISGPAAGTTSSSPSSSPGLQVVTLSPEQASATLASATVKDETFQQSVVIEMDDSSSGASSATGRDSQDASAGVRAVATDSILSFVSESVSQHQESVGAQGANSGPLLQDMGIAGTFTTENVIESTRPADLNVAQPYTVRVILRLQDQ